MNASDKEFLTKHWYEETNHINDAVDDRFRKAQDHAYALGLARGRAEAGAAAAERVRVTVIVDGETPERMREAIAQRVADVGEPTAWADGLCAT